MLSFFLPLGIPWWIDKLECVGIGDVGQQVTSIR